ncbi:MAG: hypothetical protein ACREJO_13540 [Phycisphaerales bacterium]
MDTPGLRRKVIAKLLAGPSFLVPVVAGISLSIIGWATGVDPIIAGFAGASAVMIGVGALATRALFRIEDLTREAYHEFGAEAARDAEARLDALSVRLIADNDPRTEQLLADLRGMYKALKDEVRGNTTLPRVQLLEVAQKADQLFRSCVESLERTLTLYQTSQSMTTVEARESILAKRERLLSEIRASAAHLGKILDGLRSLGLEDGDARTLAILRGELDESLTVARRVEERMQGIQAELEQDAGVDEARTARDLRSEDRRDRV